MHIFPYTDQVTLVLISGKTLKEALENGVSQYPKYDGRFPIISGLKFSFDPEKPPYQRIKMEDIILDSKEQVDPEKIYRVATEAYML